MMRADQPQSWFRLPFTRPRFERDRPAHEPEQTEPTPHPSREGNCGFGAPLLGGTGGGFLGSICGEIVPDSFPRRGEAVAGKGLVGSWCRGMGSPLARGLGVALILIASVGTVRADELFGRPREAIPEELESVYLKGMKYLATTQQTGGSWTDGYGSQPGVVGLAVLAWLAHGDDPNFGPYAAQIRSGLDFILRNANRETGYIGNTMYNHGFATLALAEAYGAVDDPRLGPALQRAVDLILTSQAHNGQGAWRYGPESSDADTTVSGAQLVALFAARNAGIQVPDEAIDKALKFFAHCSSPGGGFGYTDSGGPNNPRTAIGILAYALARKKDQSACREALQFLRHDPLRDDGYPFYFHYYASQALFQADVPAWTAWNVQFLRQLARSQNPDGSWDGNQGKVFSTAGGLLSLALNYRFLPIYER